MHFASVAVDDDRVPVESIREVDCPPSGDMTQIRASTSPRMLKERSKKCVWYVPKTVRLPVSCSKVSRRVPISSNHPAPFTIVRPTMAAKMSGKIVVAYKIPVISGNKSRKRVENLLIY
jgi:hypothetical protein